MVTSTINRFFVRRTQCRAIPHKETIAIAHTFKGSHSKATYHGECGGSNLTIERDLRKLAKEFGVHPQSSR